MTGKPDQDQPPSNEVDEAARSHGDCSSAVAAATEASLDAEAAAQAAVATRDVAVESAQSASAVATRAKTASAAAAALAATAVARTARIAAAAVASEAVSRALEDAMAAVLAAETVAAELPAGSDQAAANRRAAAVASTVELAVAAHKHATDVAARTVAAAVRQAAEDAAANAELTATELEREAAAAALTGEGVAELTLTTAEATGVVVESTKWAAEIAARLNVVNALRASEHRFRVTFEHARVGMMLISLSEKTRGRILRVNPALCDLTGRDEADLLALTEGDLVHADDQDALDHRLADLVSGQTSDCEAVVRWKRGDGLDHWVRTRLHTVHEGDNTEAYAVEQVEDITERLAADAALRVREDRFRRAFDNARTGMMFLDLDGTVRRANRAMPSLLGYTEAGLLKHRIQTLCSPTDPADIGAGIASLVGGEISIYQAEHCLQHADGHPIWGLVSGSLAHDADSRPDFLVLQVEDITARRTAETRLAHQVLHDDLTGLPNRLQLATQLKQACSRAQRNGTLIAVLFLDLDDFKEVNDSLGHVAGDQLLIEVADRLRACMRETDTAARRGGDEFVIVCEGLTDPAEARLVADRIDAALGVPVTAGTTQIHITSSIGIATADGTADPEDLLRGADTAMYRAKINGKGRYEIYDPAMRVGALRQLMLAGELSEALVRNELRLHYQPIYELGSGAIVAVEALLRWQHPTRGLLPPGEFLDVAEGRRLIVPIGNWVLAAACAQARSWELALGIQAPDMWVNIAGQQLGTRRLTETVEEVLATSGLSPSKLGLEVTERQLVGRSDSVREDLLGLRQLDVSLAVDDFGTGFASLDYLRRFPFDEIKIDQSFVSGLGSDRTDTAVTASIIALGQSLDLFVVAEGVETTNQRERLLAMGCKLAQGYLMQRPAPPAAIEMLLRQQARGLSGAALSVT